MLFYKRSCSIRAIYDRNCDQLECPLLAQTLDGFCMFHGIMGPHDHPQP